jgi:hypothetical protein
MIYQRPQRLPDRDSFRKKFPKFEDIALIHEDMDHSKIWYMDIRPNTYLIRPYSPEGFTEGGLYVKLNELWPRIWGFVLSCSPKNSLNLFPGDLIMFERWCERLVSFDEPQNPRFSGEKQPIAIVHEREILAKIEDNLIPTPF